LGGLLAAMASRYVLPEIGWRWLFAASIVPVVILSLVRWRALRDGSGSAGRPTLPKIRGESLMETIRKNGPLFLLCFALASLTIASGTMNVFYARDLPQSPWYTVMFWGNVAPGMLAGAWVVRRWGVGRALIVYALGLLGLSVGAWLGGSARAGLVFAVVIPLLNGIPFGLMGAWFNEVFDAYRTMLSGAAYNLGRIAAGFAPVLITTLGLHEYGRYFLFSAGLGLGVLALGAIIAAQQAGRGH
jgi:AAHS family cis,cis-muconate transporter-like MFS transporter